MDYDQKHEEQILIGIQDDEKEKQPPPPGGSYSLFFNLMFLIFGGGFIMLLLWFVSGLIGTLLLIPSLHSVKLLSITPVLLSPTTKYIDYKAVRYAFCSKISLIFWIIPFGLILSVLHFILSLIFLPLSFCGVKWSRYHVQCLSAVFNPFPTIIIDTNIHRFNFNSNGYDIMKYANNLSNKVVIVTGCSSGIGKETAKHLYASGCIVVMACRNQSKATKARDDILQEMKAGNEANILNIRLDLADLKTIDEFVHTFKENKIINGKLDYLINNAGVIIIPEYGTTKDNIETRFGVNHIGHFYLTNKLLPFLKQNKTRIISVSSIAHSCWVDVNDMNFLNANPSNMGPSPDTVTYDPFTYYGISKLCNLLFTRYLNTLYNEYGIVALCVHPGTTQTDEFLRELKIHNPCVLINFMLCNLETLRESTKWKSVAEGSATTLRCITIGNKEIFGGRNFNDTKNMALYFEDCISANHKMNLDFINNKNTEIDKALWDYSCNIIRSLDYLALNE